MDKRQQRINNCLRVIDSPYKLVKNHVKPHHQNTTEHEVAKFIKCLELLRSGKDFYTEVTFKDKKGRCDILVPEDYQVIEILHSETTEEALSKCEYYPKILDIIFFTTEEVLKNDY